MNYSSLVIGSIASQDPAYLASLSMIAAPFTTAASIREARRKAKPSAKVMILIELGIVDPKARTGSLRNRIYRDAASWPGLISNQLIMGRPALRLDHPALPEHLRRIGGLILESPDGREADGVYVDYAAWTDPIRHDLGAPRDELYDWCWYRMKDFAHSFPRHRMAGLNSYGDWLVLPHAPFYEQVDAANTVFKVENFWCMRATRFGTGTERLYNMLSPIMARLRQGSRVMLVCNPLPQWNGVEVLQHLDVCAAICAGLSAMFPGQVYYDPWRMEDGTPLYVPLADWYSNVTRIGTGRDATIVHCGREYRYAIEAPEDWRRPLKAVRV